MAHWDDESMIGIKPPEDVLCRSCKFKMKPAKLGDKQIDRSTYGTCDKFKTKPIDILYGREPCEEYQHE